MAEVGASETQEQEAEKKYSIEDIREAKDTNSLLEAYRGLRKESGSDLSGVQMEVAERFGKLEEPEKSFQFTLLSEQTKNFDRFGNMVEALDGTANKMQSSSFRMSESAEGMGSSSSRMIDASDNMRHAAAKMGGN